MTPDNIDTEALRALEAKATLGPWTSSYYGDGQFVVTMPRDRSLRFHRRPPSGCDSQSATVYGAPGIAKDLPGDVIVGMSGWELDGLTEQEYANQRVADGQLIVALRNAAPALLATVEAQRKEIEELRAKVTEQNDAMAEAWEVLDDVGRENPTLAMACAQLMRWRSEASIELGQIKAQHAESERVLKTCGQPGAVDFYRNGRDEAERALWAAKETAREQIARCEALVRERDALKAEVERLNSGWQSCLEALEIAKGAMLRSGAARDSYFAEAATLRAKISASEAEVERLRAAASAAFDWSPDRDGSPDIVAALQRYRAALRGEEASRE